MSSLITVATCQLNQWAMDFDGNLERIYESCIIAQKANACYRLGPELEICGYGCEDHYYEYDTYLHCWESLIVLFERGVTDHNMICDFGMPIYYKGVRYNCRIICYHRQILLIRPKTAMADDGNYRESRYFTAYIPYGNHHHHNNNGTENNEVFTLPMNFQTKFQQTTAPFGIHYISSCLPGHNNNYTNITIGYESCEELWTPMATHINLSLHGVDMICNGSASHHVLRKLNKRLDLIVQATKKCGGIYMYSNQIGCDGSRVYYDGCALIVCNGLVLAQGSQFSIQDVEVITATIDVNDVRSYRASIPSLGIQSQLIQQQANHKLSYVTIPAKNDDKKNNSIIPSPLSCHFHPYPITKPVHHSGQQIRIHDPAEECCLGPACWLWDYLRRSGASGFFLPLSGGADSSAVAAIVSVMCHIVTTTVQNNPYGTTAQEVRRMIGIESNHNKNTNNATTDNTNEENYGSHNHHKNYVNIYCILLIWGQ
jgi:NAD+ synthase (glutamine-hydrolysing)